MALVTKNDVTQIFAIQAPEIDLPPTFANYPRGWDTARSNNGKPTIKQFNYIQQRTDQNMLWIHQNGAALSYDAAMEYAEGAVTIKDGRFKQWNGTIWVNFGQDDNALKSANNLSDLENKETSRNNLGVYSKIEVDDAIASVIPPETPNATETIAGKAEIATQAETNTATDDSRIITPKKLLAGVKNHLNATGAAPLSACRAWVNFNGTTNPPTIRSSFNVASVTKSATGQYQINFDVALPTDSASCFVTTAKNGTGSTLDSGFIDNSSITNAYVKVQTSFASNASDQALICVGVFC